MNPIVIDNFAGGGGASTGIEAAIGRPIDYAINHDPQAIAMHRANHPDTHHFCEDVWEVDPRMVADGRPVDLAWFSPDCKHFSRAKGGTPVDKNVRGLAWVAIRYAATVKPRVIFLENVQEFKEWGPLLGDKPHPDLKGRTFQNWINEFRRLGYSVEYKTLKACDYGAPTTRNRLFLVARRDGKPIVWPDATHGVDLIPHRAAAEIIDWSIPVQSIFTRKKPLAENTMRRIARGLQKFVIDNPKPFIISYYGPKSPSEFRGRRLDSPLPTQTTENRFGLVVPYIARIGQTGFNGDRSVYSLHDPLNTIVSKNEHCLLVPHVIKHNTGATGSSMDLPFPTIMGRNTQNQLVTTFLTRYFGKSIGSEAGNPAPTTTAGGGGKTGIVTSHLLKLRGTTSLGYGSDMQDPVHTISAGGLHIGEVRAFLIKYYGTATAQSIGDPVHTLTSKARLGLVTVAGEDYQIADIGMRMLQPRELFLAQGFPKSYIIDPIYNGKPLTKTAQIKMVGNSVSPHPAEALVRANMMN